MIYNTFWRKVFFFMSNETEIKTVIKYGSRTFWIVTYSIYDRYKMIKFLRTYGSFPAYRLQELIAPVARSMNLQLKASYLPDTISKYLLEKYPDRIIPFSSAVKIIEKHILWSLL